MMDTDMSNRPTDPFFAEAPERVLLNNAPLIRVLCQARFTPVEKISDKSYIADFQDAIRQDYPYFNADKVQAVEVKVSDHGIEHETVETTVWRFFNSDKTIRVSLNSEAISLETANYVSRKEFLDRMEKLLASLCETIKPSLATRVGFRYVDRLTNPQDLQELPNLVHQELLNVLQPNLTQNIEISMTEVVSRTKEGKLIARFGMAPANYSHEPEVVPPHSDVSWVLDVDSFSTACSGQQLEPVSVRSELDKVAERAYAFFRWSVTEEFIKRFGGN
jgi:uncharacterized protein (TIGR04255 family)